MNNRMLDEFVHRYNAKIFATPKNKKIDYNSNSFDMAQYNTERTVEIELSMCAFEHLVKCDCSAEKEYLAKREEWHIRAKNPAVAEAYAQYKMLLELCR